jgi:methyl-accepting chemotaxis protein
MKRLNKTVPPIILVIVLAAVAAGAAAALLGGYLGLGRIAAMVAAVVVSLTAALLPAYFLLLKPLRRDIGLIHRLVETRGDLDAEQNRRLAALGEGVAGAQLKAVAEMLREYYSCGIGVVKRSGKIAIAGAEVSYAADVLKRRIDDQIEHIRNITEATGQISLNIEQAVTNSETLKELSRQTRRASYIGQEAIGEAAEQMRNTGSHAREAAELIAKLEESAGQISQITKVISEIADQTNLLALNAAIEAARAGEQGRGFAVVAEEVRNLATRTSKATTEIGQMVQRINAETGNAGNTMRALVDEVQESRLRTEKVDTQLLEILEHAREVESRVISAAERSAQNREHQAQINRSLEIFTQTLNESSDKVDSVAGQSLELSEMAEAIYELLGDAGLQGAHGIAYAEGCAAVAAIGQLFENALAQGQLTLDQLFDRNYQPIAGTNPQKYKSKFDGFTDANFPPIQEPILSRHSFMAYAGAVDNNGYFPTHNKRYSQPLSGDHAKDLLANRTKRIFNDHTGARCASSTKPFLLQTYKRDTGEVMHDLTIPIYVAGRHWGGFRIGYQSSD